MAWEVRAYLLDDTMVPIYKTIKPLGNVKQEMPGQYEHGVFHIKPKILTYYPSKSIKKIEAIEVE